MKRNSIVALLLAASPLLLVVQAAESETLSPTPVYSNIATRVARRMPMEHLTRSELNDEIAQKAFDNYLASLDSKRVFFLKSDIDDFKAHELTLDDQLAAGNVDFAYQVYAVFTKRLRERCKYTRQLLEKGFDTAKNESYSWDRRDAQWPRNKAEQNKIWRKMVKNRYIEHLIDDQSTADTTPEEAILKRYESFLTTVEDNDAQWVLQQYLTAFAKAYDPHCLYMSPAAERIINTKMNLSLVGIGVSIGIEDGAATVQKIIPGGPAERDKRETRLVRGDKIIAIAQGDGPPVNILHWPLYRIIDEIRGERGSKVVLTVVPAADETGLKTKQVDLVRDQVKLKQRAAKHEIRQVAMQNGDVKKLGVVRLPSFYGGSLSGAGNNNQGMLSSRDMKKILRAMATNNVTGVLIDLRNNGGGALREVVRMTSMLIPSGPIVQVKNSQGTAVMTDNDPAIAYAGPLVVLVNRRTASASEILAGTLQDYGRAVIVGDSKTFGKGSVQSVLPLSKDPDQKMGSLKTTRSLYYRVTGSATQLKGVTADIVLPSRSDSMEIGENFLKFPIEWTMVRGVRFEPFADMYDIIPPLAKKSRQRRANDPRFKEYTDLLTHFDALNDAKTLPLNIDKRKELAKTKEKLHNFSNQFGREGDEENLDLVLEESLNILANLVELGPDRNVEIFQIEEKEQ